MRLFKYVVDLFRKLDPIKYSRSIGVTIGEDSRLIGVPKWDSEPYLITVGNHVTISENVRFITHDGGTWVFRDDPKYSKVIKFGKIVIGDNCFIGADSIIMPGTTIGDRCVIGAGSLVSGELKSGGVYIGRPAKWFKSVEDYADKCLQETPDYDIENYRKNKREEVLKILK